MGCGPVKQTALARKLPPQTLGYSLGIGREKKGLLSAQSARCYVLHFGTSLLTKKSGHALLV